jgi:uncharacterized protein (UPF0276 family)
MARAAAAVAALAAAAAVEEVAAVAAVEVAVAEHQDRVGLGYRPELAAAILEHLDEIDVLEVIADDLFDGSRRELRAYRTLASQVPLLLHGVSLGLASAAPVDTARLSRMARVVGAIAPAAWSEHLAFVRGGGFEIGHLAAPPRTDATIESTLANVERARRVVGAAPELENIATLIEPPASSYCESEFLARAVSGQSSLLFDLHNWLANCTNFGRDPFAELALLPLDRVRTLHIAGGSWLRADGAQRVLDDHLHDVPDAVYALLAEVAARVPQPLTVVLERDGAYPRFNRLLEQLARARAALAAGRARARGAA